MFTYWLLVMRRVALPSAALSVFPAAAGAAVALEGHGDWTDAVAPAAVGLLAGYLGFAVLFSSAEAVSAFRVARRHGTTPTAEMWRFPCTREVRVPRRGDMTAAALADTALDCLRAADGMGVDQVEQTGSGISVSGSDLNVAARMHVVADVAEVVITLETRPTRRWKKLDGGASWGLAHAWEARIRAALHPSPVG